MRVNDIDLVQVGANYSALFCVSSPLLPLSPSSYVPRAPPLPARTHPPARTARRLLDRELVCARADASAGIPRCIGNPSGRIVGTDSALILHVYRCYSRGTCCTYLTYVSDILRAGTCKRSVRK